MDSHNQLVFMRLSRISFVLVLAGACLTSARAQSANAVRWVTEKESSTLWATIRTNFHDELQPDDPVKVAPVVAYSYKYIYRVATYGKSDLVIVGHLETRHSKYPGYYSAFNYDVASNVRTAIKGAEVFSEFKFVNFVRLGPTSPSDIVFTWMTCTECEASQILSSFHFDADTREWVLRGWQANRDIWWTSEAGPVIWADISASDTISFVCLYGFVKNNGAVFYGIRCREVAEPDGGKRTTTDITARYSFGGGESKLEILKGDSRKKLLADLCQQSPRNKLCITNH